MYAIVCVTIMYILHIIIFHSREIDVV